jgi:DNA-binding transcriptional ArsR family regulator
MAREKAGTSGKKKTKGDGLPERELYTISDLDQLRILADPLRVRILEALGQERTTKQVAAALGEKPTRLYHHVLALEGVGLIRRTRTRQNRGTVEKYYQAVARAFRADSSAFGPRGGGGERSALGTMIATLCDNTAEELRRLTAAGHASDLEERGIVSYLEVRGSAAEIGRLRRRLESIVSETSKPADPARSGEKTQRYRLTLAFFPLDPG